MSATEVWRNEAPSCRRKEGASFGQPSNQKLRQLPEEGAGGRRKEPEEGGRSSEEGGWSFEEGGRSFEAQASGRGRRQEGASLSWPGISFFSIAPSSFLQLLPAASKLLPEAGASEAAGRSFEEAGRSCRQELNTAGRKQEATLALPLFIGFHWFSYVSHRFS